MTAFNAFAAAPAYDKSYGELDAATDSFPAADKGTIVVFITSGTVDGVDVKIREAWKATTTTVEGVGENWERSPSHDYPDSGSGTNDEMNAAPAWIINWNNDDQTDSDNFGQWHDAGQGWYQTDTGSSEAALRDAAIAAAIQSQPILDITRGFGLVFDGADGPTGTTGLHIGTDNQAALQAAFTYASENGHRYVVANGPLLINSKLTIPEGIIFSTHGNTLYLGNGLNGASDIGVECWSKNGLEDTIIFTSRGFIGVALRYASSGASAYPNASVSKNVRVRRSYVAGETLLGTGLQLYSNTGPVSFCELHEMVIDGFGVGLELYANGSFVNGNTITGRMYNCARFISVDGVGAQECSQNTVNFKIQPNNVQNNYVRAIYCTRDDNTFNLTMWDWAKTVQPAMVEFTSTSNNNKVSGITDSTLVLDAGGDNVVASEISRYFTESSYAMLPVFGTRGAPLGNYDNVLLEAHKDIGKTISVQGDAFTTGDVNRLFHPDNLDSRIAACDQTRITIDLGQQVNGCKLIGMYFQPDYLPDTVEFQYSNDAAPMADPDAATWTTMDRVLTGTQKAFFAFKSPYGGYMRHLRAVISNASAKEVRIVGFFASFRIQSNAPVLDPEFSGVAVVKGGILRLMSPDGTQTRDISINDAGVVSGLS